MNNTKNILSLPDPNQLLLTHEVKPPEQPYSLTWEPTIYIEYVGSLRHAVILSAVEISTDVKFLQHAVMALKLMEELPKRRIITAKQL